MAGCEYPEISRHAWYTSKPGHSYGAWENGRLVCFCTYWTNTEDEHAPVASGTSVTMKSSWSILITAESARGKGLSGTDDGLSASELKKLGYRRCLTWIRHSNHPSIRAFEKAGWIYDYFLIELPWRGEKDRIRISLPRWVARLFG
ncbi:MAG: GNAT family N-acetyltransferase [Candidatus Accumulibacter sp.]|nr:GNAT family N-acetyltransferase [Accumulibacter sp.]